MDKIKDRRYIGEDGVWMHFCRECNDYLPSTEFNKCSNCAFAKYPLCKTHHRLRNRNSYHKNKSVPEVKKTRENDMDYLRVSFPTQDDYDYLKVFLQNMGYDIKQNIHTQFLARVKDKYNIDL